jgi:hypothetical protein
MLVDFYSDITYEIIGDIAGSMKKHGKNTLKESLKKLK